MNWFDVDKNGLSKLLARKSKSFVVFELLQNSWDQNVTRVDVTLKRPVGARYVELVVEDDDPDGFADLRHAYTLFAESSKKGDPNLRGRFNFGEKLVLALCDQAEISTTKGTVIFDKKGRHSSRRHTNTGSRFSGRLRMTAQELTDALSEIQRVIAPSQIITCVNGMTLTPREPVFEIDAVLPTDVADELGYLRRRNRQTTIRLYEPLDGEIAQLYELGIPVVQTDDQYHVDVQQKVPLSLERDNVPSSYLRALRVYTLNVAYTSIGPEESTASWVRDALQDDRCSNDAVAQAVRSRFGDRAVAYDPSDREANKLAVAAGYAVVHGGHLSKREWANIRNAGVLPAAGSVTPSPKPFSDDPDAPVLTLLARSDWSDAEIARVSQITAISRSLINKKIEVRIADDRDWPFNASFGGGEMIINRARVGRDWFIGPLGEDELALILHELGHHYESDHLSERYYRALCRLGARLALNPTWDLASSS